MIYRLKQLPYLAYLLILTICLASCDKDDSAEVQMEEIEEPTFHGKYSGGWTSRAASGSVYSNTAASASINESSTDQWSGDFFFSSNQTPCCGNPTNNGSLLFTLRDSTITNFRYFDSVIGCGGLFEGEGRLEENGSITIDFTGRDCEGEHSGGKLRLSKV